MASSKRQSKRSLADIKREIDDLMKAAIPQIRLDQASDYERLDYLNFMSQMYGYSARNQALIHNQYQGAGYVASFKAWKDQHVSVRKGQHGIKIMVPKPVNYMQDDEGNMQPLSHFSKAEIVAGKASGRKIERKQFYGIGHVFDITQTNVSPDHYPRFYPNRPFALESRDPAAQQRAFDGLVKQAKDLGITVVENHGEPLLDGRQLGAAKGVTEFNAGGKPLRISLSDRLDRTEKTSVLIHELAHAKLHSQQGLTASKYWSETQASEATQYGLRELQAELTSYVVSQSIGIDTAEEAMPYISGWTNHFKLVDQQPERAQAALLSDVQRVSADMIQQLDLGHQATQQAAQSAGLVVPGIGDDGLHTMHGESKRVDKFWHDALAYADQPLLAVYQQKDGQNRRLALAISPSTRKGYHWQMTAFDSRGEPWSHLDIKEAAAKDWNFNEIGDWLPSSNSEEQFVAYVGTDAVQQATKQGAVEQETANDLDLKPHEQAYLNLINGKDLTMAQARQLLAFENMMPTGQRYKWRLEMVDDVMKHMHTATLTQYQQKLEVQSQRGSTSFLTHETQQIRGFLNEHQAERIAPEAQNQADQQSQSL